jgi:hypothetical protein
MFQQMARSGSVRMSVGAPSLGRGTYSWTVQSDFSNQVTTSQMNHSSNQETAQGPHTVGMAAESGRMQAKCKKFAVEQHRLGRGFAVIDVIECVTDSVGHATQQMTDSGTLLNRKRGFAAEMAITTTPAPTNSSIGSQWTKVRHSYQMGLTQGSQDTKPTRTSWLKLASDPGGDPS